MEITEVTENDDGSFQIEEETPPPFTHEDLDRVSEAAERAREEWEEHVGNSWRALANWQPGDVLKESYEAFNALRECENLDNELARMENENIDFWNNEKEEE